MKTLEPPRRFPGSARGKKDRRNDWATIRRHEFNQVRPHESLDMRTPAEVYRDSARRYEGTP